MILRKAPGWITLSLFLLASIPPALSAQTNQDYIVRYRGGSSEASRAASVQRSGARMRFNYSIIDAAAVTAPNDKVLAVLQRDPDVLSIELDHRIFATQSSIAGDVRINGKPGGGGSGGGGGGTPAEVIPAGVARIGAPSATSGAGVGVAIVDTGIDFGHQDLAPAPDAPATAFSAYGGSCQDNHGHGTHVAGIVAAKMGNNLDVVGVAPAATVYCVKVLDSTGSGSDSAVIAGLNWIGQNAALVSPKIQVVNMSLGRPASSDDSAMQLAIDTLAANGIAVVVSACNDAKVEASSQVPAGLNNVFAVASTTAKSGTNACRRLKSPISGDTASYFTTDGPTVLISAPGEEEEDVSSGCIISSLGILSLKLGGGTTRMSGTSMSSPHVAGVVARMIQAAGGVVNLTTLRSDIQANALLKNVAPYDSPTTTYTFDGIREGIVRAPQN